MLMDEMSLKGNVRKLFEGLNKKEEAIELLSPKGYETIQQLYRKVTGGMGFETPIAGFLTDSFKLFITGYLLGLNDGEMAGRMLALRQSERIIKDVFSSLEGDDD